MCKRHYGGNTENYHALFMLWKVCPGSSPLSPLMGWQGRRPDSKLVQNSKKAVQHIYCCLRELDVLDLTNNSFNQRRTWTLLDYLCLTVLFCSLDRSLRRGSMPMKPWVCGCLSWTKYLSLICWDSFVFLLLPVTCYLLCA